MGSVAAVRAACQTFMDFFSGPLWQRRLASPDACDFVFGNPQETALPGVVDAIRAASVPADPGWFAYKTSEPAAREAVASSLRHRLGLRFEADDVVLTKGASAAMAVVLQTVVGPGDEVVYITPPWFFYEAMILAAGATPVPVPCERATFDLDVPAIAGALSPRARAVIVNSPNNPTGRVYPEGTLRRLAGVLEVASRRNDRPVYLISDEAYQRIVFPEAAFVSPTAFYACSFLLYTYGKTLLIPGQRLGYVALGPGIPAADEIRSALFLTQAAGGHGWPDAVMQHALPALERLCIDVDGLRRRRDVMVRALRRLGYELRSPEGTFYLLVRSPWSDDGAFAAALADEGVFVLPGHVVDMPGHFRVSLTASDEMVSRSLPAFERARELSLPEGARKQTGSPRPDSLIR